MDKGKETNNMDNTKTSITVGGTSFFNLLFLVFLTLKLTNVITWSWWWVTAPLWMPIAILLGILVIAFFIGVVIAGCTTKQWRGR